MKEVTKIALCNVAKCATSYLIGFAIGYVLTTTIKSLSEADDK